MMAVILGSCGIPRDPENSWLQAQESGLRVGIVPNPPYTIVRDGHYTGSEVDLLNAFAQEHDMQVSWTEDTETELVELLKEYDLDLMIGGFKENTVWADEVGVTRAYGEDGEVWLIARGENRLVSEIERFFLEQKERQ